MHVDEAGQHVVAGQVDFTRGVARTASFVDRHAGEADAADLGDPVALHNNVDRAQRRAARTVDIGHATQDESLVRSVAFVRSPEGGHFHSAALSSDRSGQGEDGSCCHHKAKQRVVPLHKASEIVFLTRPRWLGGGKYWPGWQDAPHLGLESVSGGDFSKGGLYGVCHPLERLGGGDDHLEVA